MGLTNPSAFMDLPPLLLRRPKHRQGIFSALLASNFNDNEANKVSQGPIAAMCAEHIQVLDIQGPAAAREEVVDLAVVVKEKHALFGNFFMCEVVRFKLDVGGELVEGRWTGGDGGV